MTVIERDLVSQEQDSSEHEKLSHVVVPKSAVTEAYILGTPVRALCGKVWVPTRAPERYPICDTCSELLELARRSKR